MFVFKRIYYFIFKADERLDCQFALPEVRVVMRTDSGELFHGDEYPGLDRQLMQSLAKSQKTHNSTKTGSFLAGPPRSPRHTKPTSNAVITRLVMENGSTQIHTEHKQASWLQKSFGNVLQVLHMNNYLLQENKDSPQTSADPSKSVRAACRRNIEKQERHACSEMSA